MDAGKVEHHTSAINGLKIHRCEAGGRGLPGPALRGHLPREERPEVVNAALLEFLPAGS